MPRIDYSKHRYCPTCEQKFPILGEVLENNQVVDYIENTNCPLCGRILRRRSREREYRYEDDIKRVEVTPEETIEFFKPQLKRLEDEITTIITSKRYDD